MANAFLRPLLGLILLALAALPAAAATPEQQAATTWRLLDYIAVDYREAVEAGRIKNQLEYDEMVEFSATVSANLDALPGKPQRARLSADASRLQSAIAAKAEPAQVAAQAKARWKGSAGPHFSLSRFLGRLRYPAI